MQAVHKACQQVQKVTFPGGFHLSRISFWIDSHLGVYLHRGFDDIYPFLEPATEREAWLHEKWGAVLGSAFDIVASLNKNPASFFSKLGRTMLRVSGN